LAATPEKDWGVVAIRTVRRSSSVRLGQWPCVQAGR
jgi:hypothetical protein